MRKVRAALALGLAGLAACGVNGTDSPELRAPDTEAVGAEAACAGAVASIVSATEQYVRGYETGRAVAAPEASEDQPSNPTTPPEAGEDQPSNPTTPPDAAPATLTEAELQSALSRAEAMMREHGCDPARSRADLAAGLGQVEVEGPVADAVLRRLTASLTGLVFAEPTTTEVRVGDDLHDALARLPDGSTLQLGAGDFRLDHSLVLLNGVEIRGAGRDATTIVSTAPEAAVIALTDRRVDLVALTVRREGDAPGSVLLAGPAASVVVSDARLTGGKADSEGQGGAGILMHAAGQDAAGRGTTLEATDVELRDNEVAGIVLTGGHRSSIVRGVVESNGRCGICFIGASDGSVEDTTFADNRVGVAVTGTAKPVLLRLTITGGEVGVQAGDEAAPDLQEVIVSESSRAAIIYAGTAAGSLDRVTCKDVPFGIVVGREAHPWVGETNCAFAALE